MNTPPSPALGGELSSLFFWAAKTGLCTCSGYPTSRLLGSSLIRDSPSSTLARLIASVTPVVFGAVLAIVSLQRQLSVQRALRSGDPLPAPETAVVLMVGVCLLAVAIVVSLVLDATAG